MCVQRIHGTLTSLLVATASLGAIRMDSLSMVAEMNIPVAAEIRMAQLLRGIRSFALSHVPVPRSRYPQPGSSPTRRFPVFPGAPSKPPRIYS